MGTRGESGSIPSWVLVVLLLLVAALIWCFLSGPGGYRPTPAPPFSGNVDSASRGVILAYAESLSFDSTPGAGDEQRLMVGDTCPPGGVMSMAYADGRGRPSSEVRYARGAERGTMKSVVVPTFCTYGPLARIEPELGSYSIPDSGALAAGRIVAQVITVDSAYPKLGLHGGGTTYWWVDKKGPGNTWRSVMVPSDSSDSLVHRGMILHPADTSGVYKWRQSISRFIWDDTDEKTWGTCTNGFCCKLQ